MPIATSQRFLNASQADANKPVAKVQLVLGDYANAAAYASTAASSGAVSTDYPAAGAINGDRTELNIGPASGADNDIGKASWRSAGIPDHGDTVTLTLTFSQSRTLNRVKLYHLSSHGLKSFKLEYWNGSSWIQFAATTDVGGAGTLFTTTGTLDTIDFADVSTTQIRLTITHTQVANDNANVVELEAYRVLDITSHVKSARVSRKRDYKLANPLAAQAQILGINNDRFFSLNHQPTTAETASGFINSELRPGIGVIVSYGFDYYGAAPEYAASFVGTIDRLMINPQTREATIEASDGMKALINNIDSSKLKSGQDITTNLRYTLNRSNISNFEMALDTTGINLDYFFIDGTDLLSAIRNLVQASGDALFYFNENGIATFKDYSGQVPVQKLFSSQADFDSGVKQNISEIGIYTDQLAVPVEFSPLLASGALTGDLIISGGVLTFASLVNFTGASFNPGGGANILVNAAGVSSIRKVAQYYNVPRAGTINSITIGGFSGSAFGDIFVDVYSGSFGGWTGSPSVSLYSTNIANPQASPVTVNPALHVAAGDYWIVVTFPTSTLNNTINVAPASGTNIAKGTSAPGGTGSSGYAQLLDNSGGPRTGLPVGLVSSFVFTYDAVSQAGTWTSPTYDSISNALNLSPIVNHTGAYPSPSTETTFLDGSADGSTWDVTYSVVKLNGNQTFAVAQREFWRLRVSASTADNTFVPQVGPPTLLFGTTGVWTSPVIDTGVSTISFGSISQTVILNTGTVAYVTRSSPDGVTWSAYVATSAGGAILSPLARYLQIRPTLTLGAVGTTPQILDITVSWVTGTSSVKYPNVASFTFSFDSMLLDVQQELADNLSGDTSILNDVVVQAQPLVLTGADSDTVWQGTLGTPPTNIAGGTPLVVTAGQVLTIAPVISGGMDISRMSGANPAAAVVTFAAGGAGSWVFSSIHPTQPVLTLTITGSGNITDLRIIGKMFSNASYLLAQEVTDSASIAKYGNRQLSISNPFIVSTSVAATIAGKILANFKNPVAYVPSCTVRPTWSAQVGDRVTVKDTNLDLAADYVIVGIDHTLAADVANGKAETNMVLLQVPAGS